MSIRILLFLCISLAFVHSHAAVGFTQQKVAGESGRPLDVTLWYPTVQYGVVERISENIAFFGTDVIRNAMPERHDLPLIVLSHGYRGSWRNLNWLATLLAEDGYLVAAVDHPGTTTFNKDPKQAAKWWERPRDIGRLLDWLENDEKWGPYARSETVAVIGHSLGGWTVLNLMGAQFDRDQFLKDCKENPNPRVCGLGPELGLAAIQPDEPKPQLRDHRVKAGVSLDLGLARGFTPKSLSAIDVPGLILAAGIDIGDLPQQMESGFIAQHMSDHYRDYKVYPAATHFSFMQLCKPAAIDILEEDSPGDGIICRDGEGHDRSRLHTEMYDDIKTFLGKVLAAQ